MNSHDCTVCLSGSKTGTYWHRYGTEMGASMHAPCVTAVPSVGSLAGILSKPGAVFIEIYIIKEFHIIAPAF
jgi:hypothetical protein